MPTIQELDKIAISVRSHKLLSQLLNENPRLDEIMSNSKNDIEALVGVREWVLDDMRTNSPDALKYYEEKRSGHEAFKSLKWRDYAAIRILDYIDHAGKEFPDLNLRGEVAVSNPIKLIWLATTKGTGGAKPHFFEDMLELFRQFTGKGKRKIPPANKVKQWMKRFPSGLDPRIVKLREENRDRILNIIIQMIDDGEVNDSKYTFEAGMSRSQKFMKALSWWGDYKFHLRFAVRSPEMLNRMLGESLDPDTMKILNEAREVGIPFFVNPYYLSLLHVRVPYFAIGADLAIRHYVLYSKHLVEEFGHIVAWEKEDLVEPGKPNAAGWLLPSHHNIHRRYPEVAIMIPDSMGRACGGLCSSCQRMYNFQSGHLNFNLDKLKPGQPWPLKLAQLMEYFEQDSQLRDILITGGDALMSSDNTLEKILDAIYNMAASKRKKNKERKGGEKYAEMQRVRLGTRLPAYLPQRITTSLIKILKEFKEKATTIGIRQFIIQTHFESPMEITPDVEAAIARLNSAGWTVTNQLVFTTAASRRGHSAKLRQELNKIGVLPYYTFTVKGYMENQDSFAPNARAVQEQVEEKSIGHIPAKYFSDISKFPDHADSIKQNIAHLQETAKLPFLATDRNVLNLPGVGKSLTFRVIGITRYGRRILEFDHDGTRIHSPIIEQMGKVVIIESKSISEYLEQIRDMGENPADYEGLYGYSMGETEPRMPIYEYPDFPFQITRRMTNLQVGDSVSAAHDAES